MVIFALIYLGYIACLNDTLLWRYGRPNNRVVSSLIYASGRLVWSLSTGALIWMCASGNGGIINKVLSAKIFGPLSRLTFSIYLSHAYVIWLFISTRRTQVEPNITDLFLMLLQNTVISYVIGFAFAIAIEVPVIKSLRLVKNLIASHMKANSDTNYTIKDNNFKLKQK